MATPATLNNHFIMISILDYHKITAGYFQKQSSVWQFFANGIQQDEQLKAFKTDLLKTTYKFDETSDAALYQKVNIAKEKLGLSLLVTLYQVQHSEEMNASIIYLNNEAHIVFSGKLLPLLAEDEQQAIIAHELSHVLLYTQLGGAIEIADRMVTAIANHTGTTPAHYETARLFKLYTEIFCDRGAYAVTGDYAPIVSSLVKLSTGLQTVNAEAYIRQAEEIFATDSATKAAGLSHPENFIRARAIWLWHQKREEAEPAIKQMIEGSMNIDELDLFHQQQAAQITETIIQLLFQQPWLKTVPTLALSKQYCNAVTRNESMDASVLAAQIEKMHSSLQEYFSYVLYDFATADKALEDLPLGYCFYLADELKLDKSFATAVKKEKKLSDKKVAALKKQTMDAWQQHEMQPA